MSEVIIDGYTTPSIERERLSEDLDVARKFVGEKRRLENHRWAEVLSVSELAGYARPEWSKARARLALMVILVEQRDMIESAITNVRERDYSIAQGGKR